MKIRKSTTLKKNKPRHRLALLTTALGFALAFQSLLGADLSTQPPELPPSVAPDSVVPPNPTSDPALFTQTDSSNAIAQADAVPLSSTTSAPSEPATPAPAAQPSTSNSQPSTLNPQLSTDSGKSQNVTVNLINRLVERGILTKQDSTDLIQQAEKDASDARIEAQQGAMQAAAQAAQAAVAQAVPPPPSEDSVRVTYIPEIVKNQMRDQIKQEVMAQAREENWAAPRALPDWAPRFRFMEDVRVRYQGDFYPSGNDNSGTFANFNSINTGNPYDTSISNNTFYPTNNVDKNRTLFRLRARLGTEVDLDDGFTMGFRIATGNDNSPVSENQSLGASNSAQGGNFSKYSIWLDRAFIKYQLGDQGKNFSFTVGRFDNPFFSTSMIWANDLGFDGAVVQAKYQVAEGFTPFLTAGAFPVYNTDFNFSSSQPAKFASYDKYLYAGQLGATWKIDRDFTLKAATAYYYFQNIQGQVSSSFIPTSTSDQGNTDDSRPAFAQNGNTYIALRTIDNSTSANSYGNQYQYQYYGLATPFHELDTTVKLDYNHFEPFQVSLISELVRNLAFDRNAILSNGPSQATGPVNNKSSGGTFDGGDTAWIVRLKAGSAALEKRWDWNVGMDYRYVESDALVDGFADSDFGANLAGTNLKGYSVFGNLALSPRVWLGISWMSATAIAGSPYKSDLVQFDINAKF